MKVIFLDIDGVLNSQDNADALYLNWRVRNGIRLATPFINGSSVYKMNDGIYKDDYGVLFDFRCVEWLRLIISETKAKIVISSDWRKSGLSVMQQMWEYRNLPGEVVGITPVINSLLRGDEIKEYLLNNESVTKHVIIDDDNQGFNNNVFVKTHYEKGLRRVNFENAVKILNK